MNWLEGALALIGVYPGEEKHAPRGHMYVALAARPDVPMPPDADEGVPEFVMRHGMPLVVVARGVADARLVVTRGETAVYDVEFRGTYKLHADELFLPGGPETLPLRICGEVGGRRVGYEALLVRERE